MRTKNMPSFNAEVTLSQKWSLYLQGTSNKHCATNTQSLITPQMKMVSECGIDCSSGNQCIGYCCWENPITKTSHCSYG